VSARLALAQLNAAQRDAFVASLDGIYEHSPWVAQRAWTMRPFADERALAAALEQVVHVAATQEQLALMRAHPRLGVRRPMSADSVSEQRGAGLAGMDGTARAELEALNDSYERKFGFPCIIAVKTLSVRDIIERCRARLEHDAAIELAENLRQIYKIAGFRLAERFAGVGA
jgi:OHCU decarboxylase